MNDSTDRSDAAITSMLIGEIPDSDERMQTIPPVIREKVSAPIILSHYAAMGQVILIPGGLREPIDTIEASLQPEVQTLMTETREIHVRFAPGDRLACIRVDDIEDLLRFQEQNPWMCETLITFDTAKRVYVWLHLKELHSVRSQPFKRASWCHQQGALQLHDKEGSLHYVTRHHQPREVSMEGINWDALPELKGYFEIRRVIEKYGAPVFKSEQTGKVRLNGHFWAGMLIDLLNVIYVPDAGRFMVKRPDETTALPVTEEWVMGVVGELLLSISRLPKCESLHQYREPAMLKQVLHCVKIDGARDDPAPQVTVTSFLRHCVQRRPGGSVATKELYAAYQHHCLERNAPAMSSREFSRNAQREIKGMFGVGTCNSVQRPDGAKTGYKGLILAKKSEPEEDGEVGEEREASNMEVL